MKTMKKFISVILTIMVMMSFAMPVSAVEPIDISNEVVVDIKPVYYDGYANCPWITVNYNGKVLTERQDYVFVYPLDSVDVGVYKAELQFRGNYTGYYYFSYEILPLDVSENMFVETTLSQTKYSYNGTAITPDVKVTNESKKLNEGTDYTLSYRNNVNAGTAYCDVVFIGNYTGARTLSYNIAKISGATAKLNSTSYIYDGKVKTPTVTVKSSTGKLLTKNKDYTVTYPSGRKNVGTYTVDVKFIGNYSGSKKLTFKIIPQKTNITKLTPTLQGMKVYWTQKAQVSGYQIEYSKNSNFSGSKKVLIKDAKSSSKALSGLSNSKRYYIRIRTYKTVNDKKYYSAWSGYKYATTKGVKPSSIKSLTSLNYGFKVAYNASSGISGYQVQYSKNKDMSSATKKTIKGASNTSTKITGLSGKKTYYVRTRTYKKVNGKTYYSVWSSVKSVTTKGVGTTTIKSVTAPKYRKIKVSWEPVSAASGYQVQIVSGYDVNDYLNGTMTKSALKKNMDRTLKDGFQSGKQRFVKISAKSTSYTFKELEREKYYAGRVRAYKVVDGKTYYGGWSDIKFAKTVQDKTTCLTAAQKQWYLENTIYKFSELSGRDYTFREVKPTDSDYKSLIVQPWEYFAMNNVSTSKKYYKKLAEYNMGPDGAYQDIYARSPYVSQSNHIEYCFVDKDGETWFYMNAYKINR